MYTDTRHNPITENNTQSKTSPYVLINVPFVYTGRRNTHALGKSRGKTHHIAISLHPLYSAM